MNAVVLALGAGALLGAGAVAFWWHARSPAARLARVSREAARRPGAPGVRARMERLLVRRPAGVWLLLLVPGSGGALALGGPVAAVLFGVYTLMALLAVRRHLRQRDGERLVTGLLDAVDATAEGLRAGALADGSGLDALFTEPASGEVRARSGARGGLAGGGSGSRAGFFDGGSGSRGGLSGVGAGSRGDRSRGPAVADGPAVRVARVRLAAAYRLSDSLGVPLVGLLERVEADLRSAQALRADMAAQLAGAQTSTAVLLPLPLAGLWIGASLGFDPSRQLLHTPLGAACALTAAGLQWLGLLWTGRMVTAATAEVGW